MIDRNPLHEDSKHFKNSECSNCHVTPNSQTTNWAFIHLDSDKKFINFCLPCHETEGRWKHRNKLEYFIDAGRCQECHESFIFWDREEN
jgi:hypothetical protein